ncbi:MAG: hypothetical protein RLZZ15_3555 [Verrucomicrobiota bacterium]|jgi:hypothetical protein
MPTTPHPPLYTALVELTGWSLDRTAGLPKSCRFTFGQRLDGLALDALQLCIRALYSERPRKAEILRELNLVLEQMRALWRLVHERRWIAQGQLLHVMARLDECGRMTGGWLNSLDGKKAAK